LESRQSKLEIICPSCEEKNTIKLSSEIKCRKCEEDLTKSKYGKITKNIISAGTIFVLGSTSAYQIGKHIHSEDRYPLNVEYSIIHNCISLYDKPLQRASMGSKKRICICALSKTMKKIDYDDYKKDENKFLDIFEVKASECP